MREALRAGRRELRRLRIEKGSPRPDAEEIVAAARTAGVPIEAETSSMGTSASRAAATISSTADRALPFSMRSRNSSRRPARSASRTGWIPQRRSTSPLTARRGQ